MEMNSAERLLYQNVEVCTMNVQLTLNDRTLDIVKKEATEMVKRLMGTALIEVIL